MFLLSLQGGYFLTCFNTRNKLLSFERVIGLRVCHYNECQGTKKLTTVGSLVTFKCFLLALYLARFCKMTTIKTVDTFTEPCNISSL